jgi:hypothetical protein
MQPRQHDPNAARDDAGRDALAREIDGDPRPGQGRLNRPVIRPQAAHAR